MPICNQSRYIFPSRLFYDYSFSGSRCKGYSASCAESVECEESVECAESVEDVDAVVGFFSDLLRLSLVTSCRRLKYVVRKAKSEVFVSELPGLDAILP